MKELLKTFHLNGNTIGFHPQTQKVRTISYNKINSITGKYYLRLVTLISSEVRTTLTSPKFTQEVKELYEYLYIEKKKRQKDTTRLSPPVRSRCYLGDPCPDGNFGAIAHETAVVQRYLILSLRSSP